MGEIFGHRILDVCGGVGPTSAGGGLACVGPSFQGCSPEDSSLFHEDYGITDAVRGALRFLIKTEPKLFVRLKRARRPSSTSPRRRPSSARSAGRPQSTPGAVEEVTSLSASMGGASKSHTDLLRLAEGIDELSPMLEGQDVPGQKSESQQQWQQDHQGQQDHQDQQDQQDAVFV